MAKPGDIVYYRGEWDADDLSPIDPADCDWIPHVIVQRGGKLLAVELSSDVVLPDGGIRAGCYLPDLYFPSPVEAVLGAAKDEEEYGRKCLDLASRLRNLAAEMRQTEAVR